MHDDVTCFFNGCCNVVGCLVETAIQPLSFSLEILVGRVSPKKMQGSPPSSTRRHYWISCPGGLQGIVELCRRPSGPKPEIQHNRRGRGVPTLTWEEVIIREGKRRCCGCTKMEIMSLGFYLKVIYCLCMRSCANHVGFYTIPYIQARILCWLV